MKASCISKRQSFLRGQLPLCLSVCCLKNYLCINSLKIRIRKARPGGEARALNTDMQAVRPNCATPEDMLPHHYGHEERGLALLPEIAAALKIPKRWRKCAEFVIREHMRASLVKSPAKIRDLARALENGHISRRDFEIVVAADNAGKIPDWLARYDEYLAVLKSAAAAPIPERLRGAQIGEHIRSREAQALKEFMMNEKTDKRGGGR